MNNQWIRNKIKEEINRFLERNNNEDMNSQNLWNTEKVV